MKRTRKSHPEFSPLMVLGAHPDDIEFGCGAVVAQESRAGRKVHMIICSLGESASHGTPEGRKCEAEKSAAILGAAIEFLDLGGDAHFEATVSRAIQLAQVIRRRRPGIVLAPSPAPNQHPDHARLGQLSRDASRLARYGGVKELADLPAHSIGQLLYYAITPEAEPRDITPLLIDVSDAEVIAMWGQAMQAHASQTPTREYVELQITRARLRGLSAGVSYAIALFPNDPPVFDSLSQLTRAARRF